MTSMRAQLLRHDSAPLKETAHYSASAVPELVTVPAATYVAVDGASGDVESASFGAAARRVLRIARALHKSIARRERFDAPRLESMWWIPWPPRDFADITADDWCWTAMVKVPDSIGERDLKLHGDMTVRRFAAARCVQALHVGPYETESKTILNMIAFAHERNLRFCEKHHEIYLTDPRRVNPARRRVILRRPVLC